MNSFQYAQSVQERAQSAYGDSLSEYNQERQIATAHFEAEKKELVDPLSFIGGGMASSAAGSLGKKLAAKSGIEAFEKLGQESISTTMRNAAKEALKKGKSALTGKLNGTIQNAISKDGGKDLINKTLKENGYDELTDADFANPSSLGDKILKQSVSKAKAKLPGLPDPKDVKPSNTVKVDDLKVPSGTAEVPKTNVSRTLNSDATPFVPKQNKFSRREFERDATSTDRIGGDASDTFGGDTGSMQTPRSISLDQRVPTHLNQLGNDALPNQQRVQQEMSQDDNSLGQSLTEQNTRVNGQPKPPQTDQDAIRAAQPKPDSTPASQPADADAAKTGETGADAAKTAVPAAEGEEEGAGILSKLTEVVGASDIASGGLDIGGDLLEGALGIAGLFLPGLLDTQKKAPTAPVNNFVGSYSAGTGVV